MKRNFLLLVLLFSTFIFPQNVVIITLDTTRQDSLSCYGQRGIKTENLDNFSNVSYIFKNAFSPVPQTLPAHCTIFTGTYPFEHKVRDNLINYLPSEALTLSEILKERGYSTGAVISSSILDSRFGLNQGFDFYEEKFDRKSVEIKAKETTKRALELLKKLKEPYLLWVHYYDPHYPYSPPEELKAPTSYLGEVLYMDQNLKPLFDLLDFSKTLIIIAGDHGESLWEHNEAEHGVLLYNPAISIPLFLHLPNQKERIVVKENVDLTQIMPTILDFLKIEKPKNIQQISLLSKKEKPLYIETYFPFFSFKWSPLRGIIDGNYKLIISQREKELYDLKNDPKELNNLFEKRIDVLKNLEDKFYKLTPEKEIMPLQSKGHSIPEELRKQLQSLGYIEGDIFSSKDLERSLPNPKDLADLVFFLTHEGRNSLNKKDPDTVIKKVKEILKRDPYNFHALGLAGEAYWIKEDYKRAAEIFQEAIKFSEKSYDLITKLGYSLYKMGSFDEAIKEFERALELNEKYTDAYIYYSELYISRKEFEKAETLLENALKKEVISPKIFFNYGLTKMGKKDYVEAFKYFEKAFEIDNEFKEALGNMAYCLYQLGEKARAYILLKKGLSIDPKDFSMLKAIITVALELGKNKEAEEYIKSLIELYPESEEAKKMKPFFNK